MALLKVRKNTKLELIDCNDIFLQYVGLEKVDDLLYTTDYDMPHNSESQCNMYRDHELDALNGHVYMTIQPATDCYGRHFFISHTKYPEFDDERQCIGLYIEAIELTRPYEKKIAHMVNKLEQYYDKTITIGKQDAIQKIELTDKEKECLFFLIRGQSAKTISNILNKSKRTVELQIESIKIKFRCPTKNELIAKAIELGYLYDIPQHLIGCKLVDVLKNLDNSPNN